MAHEVGLWDARLKVPQNCGVAGLFDVITAPVRAAVDVVESGAKIVSDVVEGGAKAVSSVTKPLMNVVQKIPVVGDAARIANQAFMGPVNLAVDIASGARIDRAIEGEFKNQLKLVRDSAPYAQTVVSFVPGVGSGVSAAMGAGIALAEGRSIDEAAKAAIKSALPGGPVAAAAFDTAMAAAAGENVTKAALESARNLVPEGAARHAFDIGLAVVQGEKIQNAVAHGLLDMTREQLGPVLAAGTRAMGTNPTLMSAVQKLPVGEAREGFQIAAGLLSHAGMNPKALAAARSKLSSLARQGFDAALKTQEGNITWLKDVATTPIPPKPKLSSTLSPAMQKRQMEQLAAMQAAAAKATPDQWYAKVDSDYRTKKITLEQARSLAQLKGLTYPRLASGLSPAMQARAATKTVVPAATKGVEALRETMKTSAAGPSPGAPSASPAPAPRAAGSHPFQWPYPQM